jgi:hypothetical protein
MNAIDAANARHAELNGDTTVIPTGPYCYNITGPHYEDADGNIRLPTKTCPYWAMKRRADGDDVGYCAHLKCADDDEEPGWGLLFDQVKECGINDPDEDDAPDEEEGASPVGS